RSVWRYRHLPDGQRRLWMVLDDNPGKTAGRTFACSLRIRSSVPLAVNVSIARAGESPYEGESRTVDLEPGKFHDIHLSAGFTIECSSCRSTWRTPDLERSPTW